MTKEQYEKLKEWITAGLAHAKVYSPFTHQEMKDKEKELDALMGFEE